MLAFVVAVSGCTNNANPTNTVPTTNNPSTANTSPANNPNPSTTADQNAASNPSTSTQKITDAKYANSAYLISGDTLDAAAQNAISGFQINKTVNADGTTTINLSSSNPEYQNQTYTLQPGQKLYFIESYPADDNNNNEGNIGDDKAIVTDADGNII